MRKTRRNLSRQEETSSDDGDKENMIPKAKQRCTRIVKQSKRVQRSVDKISATYSSEVETMNAKIERNEREIAGLKSESAMFQREIAGLKSESARFQREMDSRIEALLSQKLDAVECKLKAAFQDARR
jgi:predicted RNase H-like nuclease (RuvC/YqgF family)